MASSLTLRMARRSNADDARGQVFTTAAGTPTRRSHYAKTRAFCRIGPKKPRKIDDGILEVRITLQASCLLHSWCSRGDFVWAWPGALPLIPSPRPRTRPLPPAVAAPPSCPAADHHAPITTKHPK